MKTENLLTSFQWTPQPEAERLVRMLVEDFLTQSEFAGQLRDRMYREAGMRFIDLVDHISLPPTDELERELIAAGFCSQAEGPRHSQIFEQPQGIFPRVILSAGIAKMALKVESVANFEAVWQTEALVIGEPLAPIRWAKVWSGAAGELWIVERHGDPSFAEQVSPPPATKVVFHADRFRRRPRLLRDDHGFDAAERLIDEAIAELGSDYTCDLFFSIEREYWERRNRAAQVQKSRQDRLGFGWANHDHHTYRSSRQHFARMISLFEKLGCYCRERFYAGREAGWGAQVLEQPNTGIVVFADVDLSPDELIADFAHEPLVERHDLGTVGLWCALHGESLLSAGMHHLECQFDFDALQAQLKQEAGVTVMKPFTDFPFLRQAFTQGERWSVRPERIEKLLQAGRISEAHAEAFRREGAIGSHLENLERNAGFKGFNQTGVSEIISATDPRKHLPTSSV